jgi:hypothetical protein
VVRVEVVVGVDGVVVEPLLGGVFEVVPWVGRGAGALSFPRGCVLTL